MKAMRKSRVHLAVAAGLLALTATAPVVQADGHIESVGTGKLLVFPYYTVNQGWVTTVNLTNTTDKTLALKVRFHERKNSRDVLDFNIVMSPYDVWTGWVQADGDNGPQLFTNDKSCTSPKVVNGAKASTIAYTGEFDDTGGSGFPRMRDGYVEVLLMGEADEIDAPPGGDRATTAVSASTTKPAEPLQDPAGRTRPITKARRALPKRDTLGDRQPTRS